MLTQVKTYFESDSAAPSLVDWSYRLLLIASILSVLIFVLSWPFPRNSQYQQLDVGDIIRGDVIAPARTQFKSEILTKQAEKRAWENVEIQYNPPESRIRRQQTETAHKILEFISIVRSDPLASDEVRTDYLSAIFALDLSQEEILAILSVSEEEWSQIVAEVPLALGRVMRDEIRDNDGSVTNARRTVPRLISGELSDAAASITASIVGDLIVANTFQNEEKTTELREQAAAAVEPVSRSFEQGENVIRGSTKITAEDMEALEELGLLQSKWSWWILVRAIFYSVMIVAAVSIAIFRLTPELFKSYAKLSLIVLTASTWLILAKFMIIPHAWLPYLFPLATLGMLLSVLIDLRIAIVLTLAFITVILYLSNANDILTVYLGMSSLFGALILGRAERLTAFLWTGLAVVVSNMVVFAAFNLPFEGIDADRQWQTILLLTINGVLSASLALLGYFVFGNLFGITTSLQLTELSRPTHPLLRQLLLKSPGTYHHTIVVSNMAERAAAAIGADAMLTRVGAYYHDIGKTVRPYFFIENSADGSESPHSKLDPLTSAQIIISHVSDGIDLAHKYKLPGRIQDFIREHHGCSVMKSFYIPALEKAEKDGESIDERDFRYEGPSPRTKETAILMLADTCESAVRAIRPKTRQELADLIDELIDSRVDEGELNKCNLTFSELQVVKKLFGQVLQGVHHPRISYPSKSVDESEPVTAQSEDATVIPEPPLGETVPSEPAIVGGQVQLSTHQDLQSGDSASSSEPQTSPSQPHQSSTATSPSVNSSEKTSSQPVRESVPGGVEQPA